MSNLILPGDPPPSAYEAKIDALTRQNLLLRHECQALASMLCGAVLQFGTNNVLTLAPPPTAGRFRLAPRQTDNGGVELTLLTDSETVNPNGNT